MTDGKPDGRSGGKPDGRSDGKPDGRSDGKPDGRSGRTDTERGRGRAAARLLLAGGTAAVAALIAGLPWAVRDRLPGRLATHWSGGAAPDGSMPFWEASLFPAGVWLLIALATSVTWRRSWPSRRAWVPIALAPTGVILLGAQVSVVLANLDREDWHDAREP
jgi:hypothetical protein